MCGEISIREVASQIDRALRDKHLSDVDFERPSESINIDKAYIPIATLRGAHVCSMQARKERKFFL